MRNLFFLALALLGVYVVVKPCWRYWLYRPAHLRPVFLRHSENARIIDFGMWLVLIAGAFLLLNAWTLSRAVIGILGVLVYDFAVRTLLLQIEIRRYRSRIHNISYRQAREHIRDRVRHLLSP